MGDYTTVKFSAPLSTRGEEMVRKLLQLNEEYLTLNPWELLAREYPFIPPTWARVDRSSFIPFGALAYCPVAFNLTDNANEIDAGMWHVACSIKGDYSVPGTFRLHVLPLFLRDKCIFQAWYELDDNGPRIHVVSPP
jgi:hypothetical protein